jgi:putative oxidoreductase
MFMRKFEPQLFAILRIIAGFLFLWHGSQKLFDYPPVGFQIPFYIIAIGGTIEFFGGLLICLGLFTRWAAFITAGQMAYAYWMAHGLHSVLPIVNQGELAMLYCFLFLFISAQGSGIWSLDNLISRHRAKR